LSEKALHPSNTRKVYMDETSTKLREVTRRKGKSKQRVKRTVLLLLLTSTLQPVGLGRPYQDWTI